MTTATAHRTASPTKLQTGAWGARIAGTAAVGETITIVTRAGKTWDATVSRVVWSDGQVTIVATGTAARTTPARSPHSSTTSKRTCDECLESRTGLRPARDSSGLAGMVCGRCYGPSHTLSFA